MYEVVIKRYGPISNKEDCKRCIYLCADAFCYLQEKSDLYKDRDSTDIFRQTMEDIDLKKIIVALNNIQVIDV
mgnify:CR=1 FL=1